jgi:hypothetical protein
MTRVMAGMADLAGSTVGTLKVGDLVSRHPSPRWSVVCSRCGTQSTEHHSKLVNETAICKNAGCGREKVREAQNESPAKAKRRADAADAARQRQQKEDAAAKLKAAEETFTKTQREIAKTIRQRLLMQPDDECFVDPSTLNIRLSQQEADTFNRENAERYIAAHPDSYYPCPENFQAIAGYFARNGIRIVSELTLNAAVRRLSEYGLLESRPAPAPTPQPYVNLSIDRSEPPEPTEAPDENVGIDQTTGEVRSFSNFEIDRMPAEMYRKVFAVNRQFARSRW